jgi:hypothetical protein
MSGMGFYWLWFASFSAKASLLDTVYMIARDFPIRARQACQPLVRAGRPKTIDHAIMTRLTLISS